jgi:hypothetical protein
MTSVLERSLEADEMLLIVRVGGHESVEDLDLLLTCFEPGKGTIRSAQHFGSKGKKLATHIDSWLRIILMATSFPTSCPGLGLTTRARTTAENIPLPRLLKIW